MDNLVHNLLRNAFVISTSALCRRFAAALALLLAMGAAPTMAQTLGLHTEPASPRAGQTFSLELTAATCHVFWDENDPLAREVSVAGNTITVTVEYTAPPPGGGGCEASTERDVRWTIGPFPAGSYTIELVGNDPVSGSEGEGIDQAAVTILPGIAAGPSVVPAGNWAGWLALGGILAALGLWMQRRFH